MNRSGLSSLWAVQQLTELHKLFLQDLECVQSSQRCPHVMRILAEECVESVVDYLERLGVGADVELLQDRPYWPHYLSGIEKGAIMDDELNRYHASKKLADLFLKHPYLPENCLSEYKRARYAYALSDEALPEWFIPSSVVGWLEEIVTAHCFLWFAVVDYAEETYRRKGA